MFVSELEGLNQSQSLIHRAANRKVIDSDLPKDTLIINDKEAPGGKIEEKALLKFTVVIC